MKKAEAKNYFLASVFSGMYSSHMIHIRNDKGRGWQNEKLPAADQVGGPLRNLKVHKSIGPAEMHLQVFREPQVKTLPITSTTSEKSLQPSKDSADYKRRKITPIITKGKKGRHK